MLGKQNRAENEKRWAPSSFLQTITSSLSSSLPSHIPLPVHRCSVWLSVNPENDGTAIWMERKFGVPESGEWVEAAGGEGVFGIPLSLGKRKGGEIKGEEGYGPVLVVFECTPVEKGEDDIERWVFLCSLSCDRCTDATVIQENDSVGGLRSITGYRQGVAAGQLLCPVVARCEVDEASIGWAGGGL